jgi:hypothetical protein
MALNTSVTCSADLAYVQGRDMPRVKYKTMRNDHTAGLGDLIGAE